jgi:hypothetical protein
MRRLLMLAIVATLVAASCSSDDATSITAPADSASTETDLSVPIGTEAVVAPAPTPAPEDAGSTPDPAPTTADVVTEDDLTLFIAAAERALEGTSQETAVFDDPEIYIALGQASCDRFSAGATFEQIATDLLADIDTDDSNDETRLVGAVLGAATQTLCPEHADKI